MDPALTRLVGDAEYHRTFFDHFEGEVLDRSKWIPAYLPQWSSRERSVPRYRILDGQLILEILDDQEPWCPEFNGPVRVSSLQTGVYSGGLNSPEGQHRFSARCRVREVQPLERTFTPRYGYFEIRARCVLGPTNVAAFWMIGFEDEPDRSAEICIVEVKGASVRPGRAVIGYGLHPFSDPTITDEFYEEERDLDVTQFNTFAAEWTARGVSFFINDVLIRTIAQSPDYPMQFMVNIYDLGESTQSAGPMEFIVDHVVGYEAS
jgi:hypothetical protein